VNVAKAFGSGIVFRQGWQVCSVRAAVQQEIGERNCSDACECQFERLATAVIGLRV
jgi:hypothetical protein